MLNTDPYGSVGYVRLRNPFHSNSPSCGGWPEPRLVVGGFGGRIIRQWVGLHLTWQLDRASSVLELHLPQRSIEQPHHVLRRLWPVLEDG